MLFSSFKLLSSPFLPPPNPPLLSLTCPPLCPSLLPSPLLSLGLFTMRDLHNMMSEILKMQDFSHPHVMTLMGMSFDAANTPSMVMPYMANGSLLSYLKMNRPLLLVADTADVKKVRGCVCILCAQNRNTLVTIASSYTPPRSC